MRIQNDSDAMTALRTLHKKGYTVDDVLEALCNLPQNGPLSQNELEAWERAARADAEEDCDGLDRMWPLRFLRLLSDFRALNLKAGEQK